MTFRLMTSVVLLWLSAFSAPIEASTLSVQFSSEPTQFDPILLEDLTALRVAANTIGTLFQYDGKGERSKALIETYQVSRDRLQYIFQLKKNLKWSDGVPFTPEHVLLAIKRLSQAPVRAALSELFPKFVLKDCKVLDSRRVQITLSAPDAQFLNWLTLPPLAPIRADMIETYAKNHSPVVPSLAAYHVVEAKRDDYWLLKKNPEFFAASTVTIEEVRIKIISEEASLYPLLKANKLDILTKVPVLQLKEIEQLSKVVTVPVEAVTYFGFNTKKPPFQDLKNRIWFRNLLTRNKKAELANLLKTAELPASSFLPPILQSKEWQAPDQGPAQKVSPELSFSIQSDTGSRNQSILEFVQSILNAQKIGKVDLDLSDFKTHYAKLKSDPDPLFRFGWQNPVSDPYLMYQVLGSKSPNNYTAWSNARYDELLAQLRVETRFVKKSKLIQDLETLIFQEAPVVPLLHQVLRFSYSKRVSGFRANPFGVILFREIHLSEDQSKSQN